MIPDQPSGAKRLPGRRRARPAARRVSMASSASTKVIGSEKPCCQCRARCGSRSGQAAAASHGGEAHDRRRCADRSPPADSDRSGRAAGNRPRESSGEVGLARATQTSNQPHRLVKPPAKGIDVSLAMDMVGWAPVSNRRSPRSVAKGSHRHTPNAGQPAGTLGGAPPRPLTNRTIERRSACRCAT